MMRTGGLQRCQQPNSSSSCACADARRTAPADAPQRQHLLRPAAVACARRSTLEGRCRSRRRSCPAADRTCGPCVRSICGRIIS
jgi:hypothetical protein